MEIRTTYLGPTGHTGSRIIARTGRKQRTWPYDYASIDPHRDAAEYLAEALGFEQPRLTEVTQYRAGTVFKVEEDTK